jgi:phosphatidylethanolamine/phosphatidyl-N-methylethanolamine N-methyltransferase
MPRKRPAPGNDNQQGRGSPLNKPVISTMSGNAIKRAYARWAPVYDQTFGIIADAGRVAAVDVINTLDGKVLEVGVGTGISLPSYRRDLKVSGIDLSPEMLDKARQRVTRQALGHVEAIEQMDAGDMSFADESFDVVVAMYVMTVVPDPAQVMDELARVCRPGGTVILVNHFSADGGVRALVEKAMSPLADRLGWRPEFPINTVMGHGGLKLVDQQTVKPFGLFTLLRFIRQ